MFGQPRRWCCRRRRRRPCKRRRPRSWGNCRRCSCRLRCRFRRQGSRCPRARPPRPVRRFRRPVGLGRRHRPSPDRTRGARIGRPRSCCSRRTSCRSYRRPRRRSRCRGRFRRSSCQRCSRCLGCRSARIGWPRTRFPPGRSCCRRPCCPWSPRQPPPLPCRWLQCPLACPRRRLQSCRQPALCPPRCLQ